jgi:hypothetical protein
MRLLGRVGVLSTGLDRIIVALVFQLLSDGRKYVIGLVDDTEVIPTPASKSISLPGSS